MAASAPVAANRWFIGDDYALQFTVYAVDTAGAVDTTTCVDASDYAMQYVLRKGTADSDPALITKATSGSGITVTGTFNADATLNTQLVVVTIDDIDTDALRPGTYVHALKRTDTGSERTLAYSDSVILTLAAAR